LTSPRDVEALGSGAASKVFLDGLRHREARQLARAGTAVRRPRDDLVPNLIEATRETSRLRSSLRGPLRQPLHRPVAAFAGRDDRQQLSFGQAHDPSDKAAELLVVRRC